MRTFLVTLIVTAIASANAQDFRPASDLAAAAPEGLFSINTTAYDETFGGQNSDGIFGTWEQQVFKLSLDFESETVIWGKKVAQQSFVTQIDWLSPMFGGESYLGLAAITPLDQAFANQFWLISGWKYRLFSWLDVDIGGNSVLFTRRVYGPGGVATNFGHRYRSDFYLGAIARVPLEPAAYVSYDTQLQQWLFQIGLNYSVPVGKWAGVDALRLDLEAQGGYLHAEKWLATSLPFTGANWGNSYFFGEVKADLVYALREGWELHAGVRYAGNTDGSGTNGFGGLTLGPDQMVWFGCGAKFEF